ncbi:MAG: LysM peptidoglycan-binding domain-containing protein [Clostridia bacterium]|nr:LysM peptidoglycan-binding domain-containing protein [Clostridia bacterium]
MNEEAGCPAGVFVRLERGQTLAMLADKHGVTLHEMLVHNPGVHPARIAPGQVFIVPKKGVDTPK